MRLRTKYPERYAETARISLVSSFLASIFLGKVAPFDISDVCGMNLWDIKAGAWNEELLSLTAGSTDTGDLKCKLGAADVPEDGGAFLGNIHPYFVERFKFDSSCMIAPSTGGTVASYFDYPV